MRERTARRRDMTREPPVHDGLVALRADAEVRALLAGAGLPVADLDTAPLALTGIRRDGILVAVVGVERHGSDGLLRSLAVAPEARGQGLAGLLVDAAEHWAAAQGIATLHLLTQTAEAFFARRGYLRLARERAPPPIAATAQFAGLCPGAAVFMAKALPGAGHPPGRP